MDEADKTALAGRIRRERGYWARFHDILMERAPQFLDAYIRFQSGPANTGVLPKKLCEFIYIAIDISVNHMYERGGRRHMEHALKAGASPEEILQVVLLTTAVSARQPLDLGLRVLAEETGAVHPWPGGAAAEAKADHLARTGGWPPSGDALLSLSPALAEGYLAYGIAAWEAGPLSVLDKELIMLALNAAPTCLHEDGIRRHVRGALAAGATPVQIAATLQLSAALAVHTCTIGVPGFEDVMNGIYVE